MKAKKSIIVLYENKLYELIFIAIVIGLIMVTVYGDKSVRLLSLVLVAIIPFWRLWLLFKYDPVARAKFQNSDPEALELGLGITVIASIIWSLFIITADSTDDLMAKIIGMLFLVGGYLVTLVPGTRMNIG